MRPHAPRYPRRALACLAAGAALGATARADLDPLLLWTIDTSSVVDGGTPVTRALACDLDGDWVREVVIVQGTTLLAPLGPGLARGPVPLSAFDEIAVNDIARLGGAPDGNGNLRDILFVAHESGITYGYYSADGATFESQGELAGSWVDARRLATADIDGDGTDELLALNAAGTAVIVGAFDGIDLGILATHSLPSGHVGSDLFGYRHGSDASAEIAVTYATGVDIVVASSGAVTTRERSAPVRAAVALERSTSEAERLAIVTADVGTGYYDLSVLNGAGSNESVVPFGFLDAACLAAGDTDGDGDEELHVWHRYSYDLVVIRNVAESSSTYTIPPLTDPLFDAALLPFAPNASASGNQGGLCLDDLDSDGDLDAAAAIDDSGELVIALNGSIDAAELTLSVDGTNAATGFVGNDPPLMTSVALWITPDGVAGILSGNKVEVVIWTLPQGAPASEAVAVGSTVVPLNSSREGLAVVNSVSIDVSEETGEYVFATVRELAVDAGTQQVIGRGPPALLWLEADLGSSPGSGLTYSVDSTKVGDILPRPILPPPPPGGGGGNGGG